MNFDKNKKIHMIGVKGVGMTMLAQFLVEKGFKITGSDTDEVFMTDRVLRDSGIEVVEKFDIENINSDIDLIIYSTAYNEDTNVELAQAFKSEIKILTYAEALGEVFNEYYGIAVAGTHGKTTTTAWLGYVMLQSKLNPNVLVGANVSQFNGNSIVGSSKYLVIEADEYQNKLKYFDPKIVLLNNVDHDHHDFFKTKEDYIKVFSDFISKIPKDGFLVTNFDDENIKNIVNNCQGLVFSYGIDTYADFIAFDIKQEKDGQSFKVKKNVNNSKEALGIFSIKLLGKHNIYNALAVIITCLKLNIELEDVRRYLKDFSGTARRMELMGEFKGVKIIDDYAHHPTEIETTLRGLKKAYPDKKIKAVFHPHLFSRTLNLLDEFAKSFEFVDELIVLDIYSSAREKFGGVHSLDLIKKIEEFNKKHSIIQKIVHTPVLADAERYLREEIRADDVVILLGAGDVFRVGENLINEKNNK